MGPKPVALQRRPVLQVVPLQQNWFIPPHSQMGPKPVATHIRKDPQVLPAQHGVK